MTGSCYQMGSGMILSAAGQEAFRPNSKTKVQQVKAEGVLNNKIGISVSRNIIRDTNSKDNQGARSVLGAQK